MIQLHHVVKRGDTAGAVLTPHRGKDGKLIVCLPNSTGCVRVDSEAEACPVLRRATS